VTVTRRSIEVPGLHHGGVPIPQACVVGDLLVSSAISPLDPATGTVREGIEEQVELVFANVRRILEAAGGRPEDVVKCTVFVRDKSIRPLVDKSWVQMFPDEQSRPSRHTMSIDLPDSLHLQLEIIAMLGKG
jgi:2-iminobutanoate/2-iminopropanoate deaminase